MLVEPLWLAAAMDDSIPPEGKNRLYQGECRSLDHYRQVKAKEQAEYQSKLQQLNNNNQPFVYPELTKQQLEGSTIYCQPVSNE